MTEAGCMSRLKDTLLVAVDALLEWTLELLTLIALLVFLWWMGNQP